jgi:hypothetical protein
MRRTTNPTTPAQPSRANRGSWLQPAALPAVGLDPAIWSRRVHQLELWRLMEAWHAGRRVH